MWFAVVDFFVAVVVFSPLKGMDSFVMYSIHEGIRGISLDPNDNTEALMPITGTLFAVGVDFHAGERVPDCTFVSFFYRGLF